ncbi:MAG: nuclear transport factor 2 family protein [Cyanobacteria bacterium RU_5_0]|nr:nuclear transport factor 2 family protein [Cyanobacteria bacterium RU_5_0]
MHHLTAQPFGSKEFANSQPRRQPSQGNLPRIMRLVPSLLLGVLISWAGGVNAQTENPSAPSDPPAETVTPETITPETATPETPTPETTAPETTAPETTAPQADAPPELVDALAQIDVAANQKDLQTVMSFFSPQFTTSDGLTYDDLQRTLTALWERYPNLTYATELNSWEQDGVAIVAETTTTIIGTQTADGQTIKLTATITSRQRFENQKIVQQEILAEQSLVTTGENPPTVQVILPEQVTIGQQFEFDVIVQEPLGDRILLGAALEERVQPSSYFTPTPISLEVLASGGLFKVGIAPAVPDTRWVSAVIIRDDGTTTVTRRLRVVRPGDTP